MTAPAQSISLPRDKVTRAMLTQAHIVLCRLETELNHAGRGKEADSLGVADLVVLMLRNQIPADEK